MILDVPYQSQKPYERDEEGEKKWCGIVSLWMVMAYYLKDAAPTTEELLEKYGQEFEFGGFEHKSLLKIAREYSLSGYRKSWWAAPGVSALIDKFKLEGESEAEVSDWLETNVDESLFMLEKLINQQIPVIISVTKDFSPEEDINKRINHLVVLVGVEDRDLIIHDPFLKGQNYKISKEEFKKYFLRQAIIIKKN
jgi:uncharacterized protein YvpB